MMNRPKLNKEKALEIIARMYAQKSSKVPPIVVLAIRGYFEDTMGVEGQNDRGIYDDAFFIISGDFFKSYNGNTDPSRSGVNPSVGKGYAVLQEGIYQFKRLIHGISKPKNKQYQAFGQGSNLVTVLRDGATKMERGVFGINNHRGGANGTSSEGCQTVIPEQWEEYRDDLNGLLDAAKTIDFSYCLVEQKNIK